MQLAWLQLRRAGLGFSQTPVAFQLGKEKYFHLSGNYLKEQNNWVSCLSFLFKTGNWDVFWTDMSGHVFFTTHDVNQRGFHSTQSDLNDISPSCVASSFTPRFLHMASDIIRSLEEKEIWTHCWLFLQQHFKFSSKHKVPGDVHILCSRFLTSVKTALCYVFFSPLIIYAAANESREGATVNEGWYCTSSLLNRCLLWLRTVDFKRAVFVLRGYSEPRPHT